MEKFSISHFDRKEANVVFFGLDYTQDSKIMLRKIRKASYFVEPFDVFGSNLVEKVRLCDEGNLNIKDFEEVSLKFLEIRRENKIPFMISRGHLPTLYATKNLKEEKLVIFDAHADCKNEYLDEIISFDVDRSRGEKKFNGSTWLRRLLEINKIKVLIIGVRSFDEEELEFLKRRNVKFCTSYEIIRNKKKTLKEIAKFTQNSDIYLSLDLDFFDPSIFQATDYPEPGGLTYFDFTDILKAIRGKIIGCDVCCFNLSNSNLASEFLLIKTIFHVLSKV